MVIQQWQQSLLLLFFTCCIFWTAWTDGSNILVLSPITVPSHSNFVRPIVKALARRGHTLTYWNGLKPNTEFSPNVRHLYSEEIGLVNKDHNIGFNDRDRPFQLFLAFYDRTVKYCTAIYQDPIFYQLMTTYERFDLVLIEGVLNECVLPLISILKAPFIYLNSLGPMPWLLDSLGSPQAFDIFPNPAFSFSDEMNLAQRALNTAAGLFIIAFRNWILLPLVDQMAFKMLVNGSDLIPVASIEERYLSIVLANTHFSMNYQLPKTSTLVEVGGLHCLPSKPLPNDLNNFVNGSGDAGFIIVSFGSILRGSNMPDETRKIFINTFKRLKQRVLWKWEGDSHHHKKLNKSNALQADVPENVLQLPWLPQQDLLGHPKAKLFISHVGLLSTQEAVYHGVPLIAIPIFADQPINARKIHDDGYGIHLDWDQLTEDSLYDAIQKVLTDSKYAEKMKKVSKLFRDQADHPLDRATYWIEYVIRHNGAPHLKTASHKLSLIQKGLVDVTLAILSACIMLILVLAYIFKRILAQTFRLPERRIHEKKNN